MTNLVSWYIFTKKHTNELSSSMCIRNYKEFSEFVKSYKIFICKALIWLPFFHTSASKTFFKSFIIHNIESLYEKNEHFYNREKSCFLHCWAIYTKFRLWVNFWNYKTSSSSHGNFWTQNFKIKVMKLHHDPQDGSVSIPSMWQKSCSVGNLQGTLL